MFKKIRAYFKNKAVEERVHREAMRKRVLVNGDAHRMFYSLGFNQGFIGITIDDVEGHQVVGIVCYVQEFDTTIDVMTADGQVLHVNLVKHSYTVHWNYERSHIHYTKENWEKYQLLCNRIQELDEDAAKSLFKIDGDATDAKLFFWSDSYSKLATLPRPVRNVYLFGYNVHTVKTLEELEVVYADLKRKSFAPVKEWYNSRLMLDDKHLNDTVLKGDLARHKGAKSSDVSLLAVIEMFEKAQVSGGIIYDRIALNLHTNEFELIMAYNYTRIGRIDDLG